MNVRMAVAFILLLITTQSYAIDCNNLDTKSFSYQTCMLRKEIQAIDIRSQVEKERLEAQEKERSKKGALTHDEIGDNFGVLADITDIIDPTLSARGRKDCEGAGDMTYGFYVLMFCREKSVAVLIAGNNSPLVQSLSSAIENKRLEAIFIGSFNVLKDANKYALQQHKKGVAVYIGLGNSPGVINDLINQIRKRGQTEVFIKSESQSVKFVLDPIPTGSL